MLSIKDLQPGDNIEVNFEEVVRDGIVVEVSHEENKALVDNGVQEFWYAPEQMNAIPINNNLLEKLGFEKEIQNGGTKYIRGPFSIVTPITDDFSHLEMWYREDHRTFNVHLPIHKLQNLYLQMTKVPLDLP